MARKTVSISVGSTTIGSEHFGEARNDADPIPASTYAADKTAFEAALATLVADGAAPTQAHVTAANSAYTTLAGDLTNRPSVVDVVLTFDAAAVGNMSVLRAAVRRLMAYAEAGIVW